MKKLIPLLLLSSISLTGCTILQSLTGMFGNLEEEESGEVYDDIEQAIEYMNAYNYHMVYTVTTEYESEEENPGSMVIGPYNFDIALPRVYVVSPGGSEEYFNVENNNFQTVTRYYKNGEGNYVTETRDLTTESSQLKYFDQTKHNVSDYVKKEDGIYKMTDAKLKEFGFEEASLRIEGEKGVEKIRIETVVSNTYDTMITHAHLNASLTQFGQISITLPDVA